MILSVSRIPIALFAVKSSLKTKIPITTAVNGSIAPKIEVNVGPAYLIACTKVILEIAVAGKQALKLSAKYIHLTLTGVQKYKKLL